MARVKTTVVTHRRKKAVLKQAKGQFGHRSKRYQQARRSLIKSMVFSYRDRKVKKNDFRRIWIVRLNAACRENGITYSRFIKGIHDAKINLDRKMLAEIAVSSPETFKKLLSVASKSKSGK